MALAMRHASESPRPRLRALDIVRGLIMVLMAIDHVRVFSGVPAGGPTLGVFFTRWVTHFCAPGFVFFAGTAAYLHGRTLGDKRPLSRFLVVRGLWIVLLELTIMRWAWTFNFDLFDYNLAGVLWMIGWSMVVLAAVIWLPLGVVAALGLIMMFGHNLADPSIREIGRAAVESSLAWLWQLLYFGGSFNIGGSGPRLVILYSLLPWVGVMAAGYAFGRVLEGSEQERRRRCLAIGLGAVALFVVLRSFNLYGDPRPWSPPSNANGLPAALSFLNTTKYPASLLFLLMTLGPLIALLPLVEHARGAVANVLDVFGRVPLFYYVLHIPLIHVLAMVVSFVRTGAVTPWLFGNHPMEAPEQPAGYMWSLTLLYAVTFVAVGLLYFACRCFAEVKARSKNPLMSLM
jgi:uncharacterized membrane protein